MKDLSYKILLNNTEVGFVTSDHPVVVYNQFLEDKKKWGSNSGLFLKGLQIVLPLNPECALLFYDANIYRVGNKREEFVSIADDKSVEQINGLQVASCEDTIFFNKRCSSEYIRRIAGKYMRFRNDERIRKENYVNGNSKNGKYIVVHRSDIMMKLQLLGIRIRKSARALGIDVNDWTTYVRNPTLVQAHREICDALANDRQPPTA